MKQVLTLGYLLKENEICLAMKKRGFGEGNWNGFGGKCERGESIEESAIREIKEESKVTVLKDDLQKVAIMEFLYPGDLHLEVHTYFVRAWKGEPVETEEMKPSWFNLHEIPYEHMWADDPYWLPRALLGEKLMGKVWFKEDGKTIKEMEWQRVGSL